MSATTGTRAQLVGFAMPIRFVQAPGKPAAGLFAVSPASALVIVEDLSGGTGDTFTPTFTLGAIQGGRFGHRAGFVRRLTTITCAANRV
jgi:hypothetical protein